MLTVSSGRWSVSCTGGKHLIYIFTNGTWQNLVKNLSLPNFQVNYCELIWKMSVITYLLTYLPACLLLDDAAIYSCRHSRHYNQLT